MTEGLATGIEFGPWRLDALLSTRVGGEVRLAARADGLKVALRRVLPGAPEQAAVAVAREREALCRVSHPRVVRWVDSGRVGPVIWSATEWVRGVDLLTLCQDQPLVAEQAAVIVHDLADALVACHESGVLHGDLAPTNLVVDAQGQTTLIDFGLAESPDGPARAPHSGTPAYIDPEAHAGAPRQPASDIYALGLLWARAMLGAPPLQATDAAPARLSDAQLRQALERAGWSASLLRDCLSSDPAERPLATTLRSALSPRSRAHLGALSARLWRAPVATTPVVAAEDRGEQVTDPGGETVTGYGAS